MIARNIAPAKGWVENHLIIELSNKFNIMFLIDMLLKKCVTVYFTILTFTVRLSVDELLTILL